MKVVRLGHCCINCFDAVNFRVKERSQEHGEAVIQSANALAVLAEKEGVNSLHTGDPVGFRWSSCSGCGEIEGGERYELYGLAVDSLNPVKVEIQRGHNGHIESETAEFNTPEEAREWANIMRTQYGYRKVWIDGSEYNGKA